MPTLRERSAACDNGTDCQSSCNNQGQDSRSFPRFQPIDSRRDTYPPRQPSAFAPKNCTRTHSLKMEGQVERRICCSAHPQTAGCCSARPAVIPLSKRAPPSKAAGKLRPYCLPYPLGGSNCGKSVPFATLIYKTPDNVDFGEGGEGDESENAGETAGEEGSVEATVTHSCPISSPSPEPRPRCCRRPLSQPGQPLDLEVILREQQPGNANQAGAKSSRAKRRSGGAPTKAVTKDSARVSGKLRQRKGSASRSTLSSALSLPLPLHQPLTPPPRLPHQQQRRTHNQFANVQMPQPLSQQLELKVSQQQHQKYRTNPQYLQHQHRQKNQHQHQPKPAYLIEHNRSHSVPSESHNEEIYSVCNILYDDKASFGAPETPHQQSEQRIHRSSFAGMLRSGDSYTP